MAPHEHLDWFEDNIDWFLSIDEDRYATPVPACPGWNVAYVVGHLSIGLGFGYSLGMATAADAIDPYPSATWPAAPATAAEAEAQFGELMHHCLEAFRSADPEAPCWTYAGAGVAGFWFQRAAIETTLHRMDVADALGFDEPAMPADRSADAIAESISFALPFASDIVGAPAAAIEIRTPSATHQLGDGIPAAVVTGEGTAVLAALWGRSVDRVEVTGDHGVADEWLGIVEAAFSGR